MHELPRRESTIRVPLNAMPGAVMILEPLTDEQYLQINESSEITYVDGPTGRVIDNVTWRLSGFADVFRDRLRGIEGVAVDGAPWTADDPEHQARVQQPWIAIGLAKLFRYSQGLTEAEVGNSTPPAAD